MLDNPPPASIAGLSERFLACTAADLVRLAEGFMRVDYDVLARARLNAERRAYEARRDLPARADVFDLGRALEQRVTVDDQTRLAAEIALHGALIGVAARDLISAAEYATLLVPVATTFGAAQG